MAEEDLLFSRSPVISRNYNLLLTFFDVEFINCMKGVDKVKPLLRWCLIPNTRNVSSK